VKLKPTDATLRELMNLAMAHVPATRAQGIEQARAWAAEEPENALAQRSLGRSLIVVQNWNEALIAINHACQLAPDAMENRSLRIQCRCALGEYGMALEELTALRDGYPQNSSITIQLIRLLAACPEETVRDGVRALELAQQLLAAQQTAIGQETLACALHEVGRTDEALAAINSAIEACGEDGAPAVRRRMDAVQTAISQGLPFRERWPLADPGESHAVVTDPAVEPGR
jgi:tetratricopeptide (TPR) repeat protein